MKETLVSLLNDAMENLSEIEIRISSGEILGWDAVIVPDDFNVSEDTITIHYEKQTFGLMLDRVVYDSDDDEYICENGPIVTIFRFL